MAFVTSEVARLRRVVVQRPGPPLERMVPRHVHPDSSDYLLFDELVVLGRVLSTSAQVGFLDQLLEETLVVPDVRRDVIDQVVRLEGLPDSVERQLREMGPRELVRVLMEGGPPRLAWMPPLPHLIFPRDLLAVVGGTRVPHLRGSG